MLEVGLIEPLESPWSTPIVVVKSQKKKRFCLDFRAINKITKKDAYPIPQIDRILDKLREARFISTIDLHQAFHQIPLAKNSREITAFAVSGKGHFQYKVMPFGLSNAPATFQRFIDSIFGKEFENQVFKYLDDIIIISSDFESHLRILERVLKELREAGLTINQEKSDFVRSRVPYLGFVLDAEGIHIDPEKVQPIYDLQTPRTVKQVRRLLGMVTWYRRFVPDLSIIAEPIFALTRNEQKWHWGPEQEKAFSDIKKALTTSPILTCPDFSLPFLVQCHASTVGLGAVLSQVKGGKELVISYGSRTLNGAERKYSETEKECLAVIWAVKKFRPYLDGNCYSVITDAHSIRWLLGQKLASGRLARWAVALQDQEFEIISRKGTSNCVPEALSETPDTENSSSIAHMISVGLDESLYDAFDSWYSNRYDSVAKFPEKHPDWRIDDDGKLYYHRPCDLTDDLLPDLDA